MDTTKKVIVQIDISDNEAEKKMISLKGRAAEYREENVKLGKQLKQLAEEGKAGTSAFVNLEKTMRQNEVQIKSLGNEARVYERILVSATTAQRSADGSMLQSMAALSSLTAQYKILTAEQRENSEAGIALKEEIANITATLKAQEAELGVYNRNVGNYASAFDGIKEKLSELQNLNVNVNKEGFQKSEQEIAAVKAQLFEMGRVAIGSASTINELQQVVKTFAEASIQATGQVKEELAQIAREAKAKIDEVNNSLKDGQKQTESFTSKIEDFAKGFIAALTVDRVIGFLNDSADAFAEAEDNARKLQAAVGANGGVSSDFDRLISQSVELQKNSIFSDDEIQKAQTFALNAGLSAEQVKRLIPIVADFASRTGQDLSSAIDKVVGGMNGQGKALKDYGIVVDSTGDRVSRLTDISEQLNKKFAGGAAAVAEGTGAVKQYANEVDDLMESVGSKYLPVLQIFKLALLGIAKDIANIFSGDIFKDQTTAEAIEAQRVKTERLAATLSDATIKQNAFNLAAGVNSLQQQRDALKVGSKEYEAVTGALNSALGALQAYNAEIKFRNENGPAAAAKAEADLTTLTTAELKKRLEISKASNLASAQDTIDKINDELARRQKLAEEKSKLNQQSVDAYSKALESLRGVTEKSNTELLNMQAKTEAEKLELQKQNELKELEAAFQHTDKLAEAQRLRGEAIAAINQKYILLNDADVKKSLDETQAAIFAELDAELIKINEAEEKKKAAKEEAKNLEAQFVNSDFQNQLNELDAYYEKVINSTSLSEEKRNAIIEGIAQKRSAIIQEENAATLSSFGNFFSGLSALSKKSSFEQKAFAIGATTIDTYVGAQKAFNSQFIPGDPTSLVRAILAAATATIGGLARVKQIATTKEFFQGGYNSEGFTEQSGDPRRISAKSNADRTVHHNEYIAPARVLRNPIGAALVNQLEALRTGQYSENVAALRSRSFETGGFVPPSVLQSGATVNVKGISADEVVSIVQATVQNMKQPVVLIEDVISANDSALQVEQRANY